jgi:hypothetical protein
MQFQNWLNLNESSSAMIMSAFHCGSNFTQFSTDHSGSGEGMRVLGPGIYFVTNEDVAKMYCKYTKTSTAGLYEAEIDTTNFYCNGYSWNRNAKQSELISERVHEIAKENGYENAFAIRGVIDHIMGKAPIGGIVKILGWKNAIEALVSKGVQGALEFIQPEVVEMAVFDTSVIKMKNKKDLPMTQIDDMERIRRGFPKISN